MKEKWEYHRYVPSNALFKVIVKINIYAWTWQYILAMIGYQWRSIQCMSQFMHCITLRAIHFVNIQKANICLFGWPSCIIQWPLGPGWAKLSIGWQRVESTLEWSSSNIISTRLKLYTSLDDFVNIILTTWHLMNEAGVFKRAVHLSRIWVKGIIPFPMKNTYIVGGFHLLHGINNIPKLCLCGHPSHVKAYLNQRTYYLLNQSPCKFTWRKNKIKLC